MQVNPRSAPQNLLVLYEDNHLLVVNKRSSDIVQGDKTGDRPLSEVAGAYIKSKYNKPGKVFVGVPHRLDRPVSGALVFARTSKALERLAAMFREKTVDKTYWAIVKNRPPQNSGTLEHHLLKKERMNKSFPVNEGTKGAKAAVLDYRVLGASERYFLLEIKLHTGRHHQIRTQLAAMGCPIKGDVKYGFDRPNPGGSIHLHARSIAFVHPVKKEPLKILADLPSDPLWNHFKSVDPE